MSYKGVPTDQGGAEIFPDIASAAPEVSADGLTWTFTLKQGVKYGDPFGDVERDGRRLHPRARAHG